MSIIWHPTLDCEYSEYNRVWCMYTYGFDCIKSEESRWCDNPIRASDRYHVVD